MSLQSSKELYAITKEREIEIHALMAAQLLPYMTPEDAFNVVTEYLEHLHRHYANEGHDTL